MNSLADAAATKATVLEARIASIKATKWKTIIGVRAPECDPMFARPTKTAYRYTRCNTVWQISKLGNTLAHTDIHIAEKGAESEGDDSADSE